MNGSSVWHFRKPNYTRIVTCVFRAKVWKACGSGIIRRESSPGELTLRGVCSAVQWPFSQKFLRILVFSLLTKYLLILVSAFHERLRKYNWILKKNILRTTKSFLDDVLSLSNGSAWLHHVHRWTGDAKDIYAPWMDILRTIWRTEYRNCRGVFLRVQVSV